MTPYHNRRGEPLPASPAPLLAVIEREILERREAMKALEKSWLDALRARDLVRVRWIAYRAAEHRRQLALARAERAIYSNWNASEPPGTRLRLRLSSTRVPRSRWRR